MTVKMAASKGRNNGEIMTLSKLKGGGRKSGHRKQSLA